VQNRRVSSRPGGARWRTNRGGCPTSSGGGGATIGRDFGEVTHGYRADEERELRTTVLLKGTTKEQVPPGSELVDDERYPSVAGAGTGKRWKDRYGLAFRERLTPTDFHPRHMCDLWAPSSAVSALFACMAVRQGSGRSRSPRRPSTVPYRTGTRHSLGQRRCWWHDARRDLFQVHRVHHLRPVFLPGRGPDGVVRLARGGDGLRPDGDGQDADRRGGRV